MCIFLVLFRSMCTKVGFEKPCASMLGDHSACRSRMSGTAMKGMKMLHCRHDGGIDVNYIKLVHPRHTE